MLLHGFHRSSASWRVRIALGLKNIEFEQKSYTLRAGDQRQDAYLALNPQGLVPSLELEDGTTLTQSLAILEYLDEIYPDPKLVPSTPLERAEVRSLAQIIACDIHPVQNLKILQSISALTTPEEGPAWAKRVIFEGLAAMEKRLESVAGAYCFGDNLTIADICLIPQLGNAKRFDAMGDWPNINRVAENCDALDAFQKAAPQNQPDAA